VNEPCLYGLCMEETTLTTRPFSEDHVRIARAIILLKQESATTGVLRALTLLEATLPLPGTQEYRHAFQVAHADNAI
jgi:hypothetical protein